MDLEIGDQASWKCGQKFEECNKRNYIHTCSILMSANSNQLWFFKVVYIYKIFMRLKDSTIKCLFVNKIKRNLKNEIHLC